MLFSGRFLEFGAWFQSIAAVAGFCLVSSAAYLVNDLRDRQGDRQHPTKRFRPIAAGSLSPATAIAAAAVMVAIGFVLAGGAVMLGVRGSVGVLAYKSPQPLGGAGLLVWLGGYALLNMLYTFWLKHRAIVDVLVVAMMFVMRAMGGAAAIAVPISPWLVVCTFTLCLFMAVAKRRSETVEMPPGQAHEVRKAHLGYQLDTIEHMLTVSAAMALMTYSLYCLAPRTVGHIGSGHMVWTIPLVIYGTFRYYRRCHRPGGSDIVAVLTGDRVMWLVIALYVALVALITTFGRLDSIKPILDV